MKNGAAYSVALVVEDAPPSFARALAELLPQAGIVIKNKYDSPVLRWQGNGVPHVLLEGMSGYAQPFTLPVRCAELVEEIKRFAIHFIQEIAINAQLRWRHQSKQLINNETNAMQDLTDKENGIIASLMAAKGEPVARETLLKEVWGYADALETHTLETHIYRLRQKLRELDSADNLLETAGDGYRLVVMGHESLVMR